MASSPETAPTQTSSTEESSNSSSSSSSSSSSPPPPPSSDSSNKSSSSNSSTPSTPPKSSPSSDSESPPAPPPPSSSSSSTPPEESPSTSSDSPPSPSPPSKSPPSQSPPPPSSSSSSSPPADSTPPPPPPPDKSSSSSSSKATPSPPPPSSPNSPPSQTGSSSSTPSYSPPPDNSNGGGQAPPPPAQSGGTPSSSSPPSQASNAPPGPVFSPPTATANGTASQPAVKPPGGSTNRPGSANAPPALAHMNSGPAAQTQSKESNNTNTAVIAGAIGGGVVILALMVMFIIFVRKKKKKTAGFYPPKGGEQYYKGDQWTTPQAVQLPPPPGFMGGTPGNVGMWGVPPGGVPPPPMGAANTSSEFSSGYSGQAVTPMGKAQPSPNIGAMAQFSHEELATATGGFSQANLLGQGGFGFVHKGILPDNREVAVKSLKSGSGQGEREFQAEVEIISRVHHRHLVSLVGYCIANGQRMLVYEFVPNKTLEFHLHGKGQPVMDWPTRVRIAVGSAKGLAYLHEDCHPRIIHRDIKAANILLDYNFEAMVADFGLAKLTSDNYTHVSTRVMGTFGYLAPEYASSGKLSEKSDVFSFGVMLLELITGRRPIDLTNAAMEDSLVDWARPLLTKAQEVGNYDELVDPRLEGRYDPQEIAHMATCAAASIRHSARRRPKMSQIVRALEGDSSLDDLNEGVKPGQSNIYNPNANAEAYDTNAYNADMDKFRKMVLDTKDFNSSEYGTTSEYGLNPSASSSEEMSKKGP